jgi:hypothetical protein
VRDEKLYAVRMPIALLLGCDIKPRVETKGVAPGHNHDYLTEDGWISSSGLTIVVSIVDPLTGSDRGSRRGLVVFKIGFKISAYGF